MKQLPVHQKSLTQAFVECYAYSLDRSDCMGAQVGLSLFLMTNPYVFNENMKSSLLIILKYSSTPLLRIHVFLFQTRHYYLEHEKSWLGWGLTEFKMGMPEGQNDIFFCLVQTYHNSIKVILGRNFLNRSKELFSSFQQINSDKYIRLVGNRSSHNIWEIISYCPIPINAKDV